MSEVFMNTYHRLPVVLSRGEGSWVYDINGKKHLDLSSGLAVNCMGHAYPPLIEAISKQAAKLNHTCNYFMSDVSAEFAAKLVAVCAGAGMKKVFLSNSGGEANEGAIKLVRKYSLQKYGKGRHTIVTLKGSFHGRTITTLAATGQDVFHQHFWPFTEGFTYVEPGDIEALDKALDPKICAGFMAEPVQCESGIRPLSQEFVSAAAKLCKERDILLIFDEIQSGMGRSGTFLACEGYGVKPDVVTVAKAITGGIPSGAFLAGEKAADVLQVGDHGSTFGGNPIAAAAGLVILDTVTKPEFLKEIARKGEKMISIVNSWKHPKVTGVRGKGMMMGVDINCEAWPVLETLVAQTPGILLLAAGKQTLRFLPPYIISDEELEQGFEIIRKVLQ